ncbi:unnamed protein product [Adineta steineri]|uniref:Fibronectin type-II domain-containing protein n=1 Tax=Adineta steineri TaxID=433720 RepID=A0A818TMT8_9BILA|nr:unnamed protein product [Adineta steineri]CAF3689318.1 unnamed protein product [Adineta steineri]
MACRLIVSFLIVLACASIYADNDWSQFPDSDKYGIDKTGCVFPFTYLGKTYNDCTNDGSNGDWPWCSFDDVYAGYFRYCYDFRNTTFTCSHDPYTVNQKSFTGCAKWTTSAAYEKCKTADGVTIFCPGALDKPKSKHRNGRLPKCDPAYSALSPNHTMCYAPNDYCVEIPIDDDQKQAILDTHNAYRAAVGADHMFVLHWDDELAKMALARGLLGGFDHDMASNRKSPVYQNLNGQNMVYTTDTAAYQSMSDLIDQMLGSEKPNFDYNVGCNAGGNCLHYTQAMISNLTRVGCAFVQCTYQTRVESFLVCNYIESQYASKYMRPYETNVGPAGLCDANKVDATGNCDCGPLLHDQSKEYIHPKTCEVLPLPTAQRKKRESEAETTIESKQPVVAVPAANYNTLLKRKRRGFNEISANPKNTIKAD